MEVKLTIATDDEAAIAKIFEGLSTNSAKTNAQEFCQLATTLFLDWLSGRKRFRSLTEQYIDWVEQLYVEILPPNTKPSFDVLYNSFNMSPGQAAYISRVLMEKNLSQWRTLAKTELKRLVAAQTKPANQSIKDGDNELSIDITMSKLAGTELKRISDQLREKDELFELPHLKGMFGSNVIFSINVNSIIKINQSI